MSDLEPYIGKTTEYDVHAIFDRLDLDRDQTSHARNFILNMIYDWDLPDQRSYLTQFEQTIKFAEYFWAKPLVWSNHQLQGVAMNLVGDHHLNNTTALIKSLYRDDTVVQAAYNNFKWAGNILKSPLTGIEVYSGNPADVRFLVELFVAQKADRCLQTFLSTGSQMRLVTQMEQIANPVLNYRPIIRQGHGGFVVFINATIEKIIAQMSELKPQLVSNPDNVVSFLRPKC